MLRPLHLPRAIGDIRLPLRPYTGNLPLLGSVPSTEQLAERLVDMNLTRGTALLTMGALLLTLTGCASTADPTPVASAASNPPSAPAATAPEVSPFDTHIRVKTNAVELLRKELAKLEPDVIGCGDWQQPAEDRYQLSRRMLEVVLEFGFPLFIVERSPLLTRDIDLLVEIDNRSKVSVTFSMSSLNPVLKQTFEQRSPGVMRRFQAMAELAAAGILVGTSLMPIIPLFGDDAATLEEVIVATKDHGGSFVLGGGLSMSGIQAERTLAAAVELDESLEEQWRDMPKLQEQTSEGIRDLIEVEQRLRARLRSRARTADQGGDIPF